MMINFLGIVRSRGLTGRQRIEKVEEAQVDVKYHLINLFTVDEMAKKRCNGEKLFTVDVMAQKGVEI